MANAEEASASTARPRKLKKRQRRVRQQQQEGTELQPTPEERTSDRDLGAPLPATVPTIPYQGTDTGGEIGRGALGEDGRAKDPATMDASQTAKLTVGLRSTEEKRKERASKEKSNN